MLISDGHWPVQCESDEPYFSHLLCQSWMVCSALLLYGFPLTYKLCICFIKYPFLSNTWAVISQNVQYSLYENKCAWSTVILPWCFTILCVIIEHVETEFYTRHSISMESVRGHWKATANSERRGEWRTLNRKKRTANCVLIHFIEILNCQFPWM